MSVAVLFDLDGVIADFVSHAFACHKRSIPLADVRWDFLKQIGFATDDAAFWEPLGYDFWRTIPVYTDGSDLLAMTENLIDRKSIGMISSPCATAGCIDGKRAWIGKHFSLYARRLFTGNDKHLLAGPGKILVDDNDDNCRKFRDAGGIAILVPRPWNERRAECIRGHEFEPLTLVSEIEAAICQSVEKH